MVLWFVHGLCTKVYSATSKQFIVLWGDPCNAALMVIVSQHLLPQIYAFYIYLNSAKEQPPWYAVTHPGPTSILSSLTQYAGEGHMS